VTIALHGDPASCSQAGGSLRRLASELRAATARAAEAHRSLDEEWSGRVAHTVGRGCRALLEASAAAAAELDRAGAQLQEHATDLAEALQEVRTVEQRAGATGLAVAEGQVVLPWGVAGVADVGASAAREEQRAALQAQLDRVALQVTRRRARLTASLEDARVVLAEHSATLRQ
jgi:hypothetical protein